MKKIFILTICVLFASMAFSQERVNRPKLHFSDTTEIITHAVGWAYNHELGEWIDYDNVISRNKNFKTKKLQGDLMNSHAMYSFLDMQVKAVSFENKEYYILILKRIEGAYEYPAIKKDWYTYKTVTGYIFTRDEYYKLYDIGNYITRIRTEFIAKMNLRFNDYDESVFLDKIQNGIEGKGIDNIFKVEYVFPVMISTEGNVRFYIPYNFDNSITYNFDEYYFETSYENFSKIIFKQESNKNTAPHIKH